MYVPSFNLSSSSVRLYVFVKLHCALTIVAYLCHKNISSNKLNQFNCAEGVGGVEGEEETKTHLCISVSQSEKYRKF